MVYLQLSSKICLLEFKESNSCYKGIGNMCKS